MPVGKPRPVNYYQKIKDIDDSTLADYYLDIKKIPCLINSPFRQDKKPSFGIYMKDGKIRFKDFSTNEKGDIHTLLQLLWNMSFEDVCKKIYDDFFNRPSVQKVKLGSHHVKVYDNKDTELNVKIRNWEDYDMDYWKSYGISRKWLDFAEVYPVSHIIITGTGYNKIIKAEKYTYVYVEHKEDITTIKIYRPYNTEGFKWMSKHDSSVISLWSKLPEKGREVCICSSVKDALCLWSNTGIPSIAIQAEGVHISNTAANELRKRFENIYILLDNDAPGLAYAERLSNDTGFINVVLPKEFGAKDISDYYKLINNKQTFKETILKLFKL